MAGNSSPIFVATPRNEGVKITTAASNVDGASSTLLFQADATNGSRLHAIAATPTGTLSANTVLRFFIEQGGVYHILAEKAVPAYTPAAGVPAPTTSFLEYGDMPFLDPSERFLTLQPGEGLYVAALTAPDTAIHCIAMGGDY